jgi:hypothetical protein
MNIRISNVDSFSAILDRLVCENIKLYFFRSKGEAENVSHQKNMIAELKIRITEVVDEILSGTYNSIGEKRTFNVDSVVESLEELCFADINIGEADRARLSAATSREPDIRVMVKGEKLLRKANETRAKLKNDLDDTASEISRDNQ